MENRELDSDDSINSDSFTNLVVTGGFSDNISIYCIRYVYPELSFRYIIRPFKYEAKQSNENLFKFPFKNVIEYDPKEIKKVNNHKEFTKYNHNNIFRYLDYIRPLLLHPTVDYSEYSQNVVNYIRNKGYTIVGIRWRYPFIKVDKVSKFSILSLTDSMERIEKYLMRYKNFVLMFDDWNYINMFTIMFRDLLVHKKIIILRKIDVNAVHELYYIAKYCTRIVYTGCSRFYRIMERAFLTYY